MGRDGEDVAARMEDGLRAVAVVRIDVEHRHAVVATEQALGCHGAVVDVAETARAVAMRVVAGRPAQRVGHAVARQHGVGGRHGGMRGAQDRSPGVRPDRARQIAQVVAGARDERRRRARRAVHAGHAVVVRREIRQHLDARLQAEDLQRAPVGVGGLEVVEVVDAVDRLERRAADVRRRRQRDAAAGQCVAQRMRAAGQVGRLADAADAHVLLRVVQ
jgi:hypothetical protein